MDALEERLNQPDVIDVPDWEAADILNRPDSTLPEVVEIVPKLIGIGQILTTLGPDVGAAFLDTLSASSVQRPLMKYVIGLLERGEMDAGSSIVRTEISSLQQQGLLTLEQANSLLSLGERRYFPSWAQANSIYVDARVVGIARGGRP